MAQPNRSTNYPTDFSSYKGIIEEAELENYFIFNIFSF